MSIAAFHLSTSPPLPHLHLPICTLLNNLIFHLFVDLNTYASMATRMYVCRRAVVCCREAQEEDDDGGWHI